MTAINELSGDIALEITSDDKRRHSLDPAMSKNSFQAKQKLYEAYDPAICALASCTQRAAAGTGPGYGLRESKG